MEGRKQARIRQTVVNVLSDFVREVAMRWTGVVRIGILALSLIGYPPLASAGVAYYPSSEEQVQLTRLEAARQKSRAEHIEYIQSLRKKRDAIPAKPGNPFVERTTEEMIDSLELAIADLDDILISRGYLAGDPNAPNPEMVISVDISANLMARLWPNCAVVLHFDRPVGGLGAEIIRAGLKDEERPALLLTCKAYWKGYLQAMKDLQQN